MGSWSSFYEDCFYLIFDIKHFNFYVETEDDRGIGFLLLDKEMTQYKKN